MVQLSVIMSVLPLTSVVKNSNNLQGGPKSKHYDFNLTNKSNLIDIGFHGLLLIYRRRRDGRLMEVSLLGGPTADNLHTK